MDIETRDNEKYREIGSFRKVKSSGRMVYDAQVKSIIEKHGNLEKMRMELGLTRRKLCQLLLVDPSAWTRWTKSEASVPPHVFRALEWRLELQKISFVGRNSAWNGQVQQLKSEIQILEGKTRKLNLTVSLICCLFAGFCLFLTWRM